MDKAYNQDGQVAVLVSYGYGAGWSTWNQEYPEMLYSPEVVTAMLAGATETDIVKIAEELYPDAYAGGTDGLTIVWVDEGTKFIIQEYDGSESLWAQEDYSWEIA